MFIEQHGKQKWCRRNVAVQQIVLWCGRGCRLRWNSCFDRFLLWCGRRYCWLGRLHFVASKKNRKKQRVCDWLDLNVRARSWVCEFAETRIRSSQSQWRNPVGGLGCRVSKGGRAEDGTNILCVAARNLTTLGYGYKSLKSLFKKFNGNSWVQEFWNLDTVLGWAQRKMMESHKPL